MCGATGCPTAATRITVSRHRVLPRRGAQVPRQPLERDGVHEAQIDHESPQVRPERRARRHVGRRVRPESLAAARAQPAMQRHPRDVRLDLRNLDVVVVVAAPTKLNSTPA